MKIKITFLSLLMSLTMMSQSGKELADVYFNKAEAAQATLDFSTAKNHFLKGVKKLDTIKSKSIAEQGTQIFYELKEYNEAMKYAQQFFLLSKNKSSEMHKEMLAVFVDLEEKISSKEEAKNKKIKEDKEKERAKRVSDSLRVIWSKTELKFTLQIDSLYKFDKKGVALYSVDGYYGIINDKGVEIVEADTYRAALQNEGYFLLMDFKENPQEIYAYNSRMDRNVMVGNPSNYNENLTSYGVVTLPRANGRLVMYPEEIGETLVFDLEKEEFITTKSKGFLNKLKDTDKIDKFKKGKKLKKGKNWYKLGNHLGGNVYSLHAEKSLELTKYLFAGGGKGVLLNKSEVGFIGAYYRNKLQGFDEYGNVTWYTNKGEEGSKPLLNSKYKGDTEVVRVKKGYQLVRDGKVFLKNKELEPFEDFVKRSK